MNRAFMARLNRLDGGAAAIGNRADRAAWWAWRGKPHSEWPEEALSAFTRSGDAKDPEVKAELDRMSGADLDWSIWWHINRPEFWTPNMVAALPELPELHPIWASLQAELSV